MDSFKIPNKSTFSLTEACSVTGIKPYVLRFWEAEFSEIKSIQSSSGQKLYTYDDVESLFLVKDLLFTKKLTIEQARPALINLLESKKINLKNNQEEIQEEIQEENICSVNEEITLFDNDNSNNEVKDLLNMLLAKLNNTQNIHNWV